MAPAATFCGVECSSSLLLEVTEEATRNQLSTLNGCYIPCLLNILGAVLFLRVGFAVGMMGFVGALGIFAFSEAIAYLTITSFSAIVTNGRMAGGGAYFMISRNLGPAFGGSSGILFWFTYCLNVTFNTVSFTQTIQQALPSVFPPDSWWGRTDTSAQLAISSITLFLLFLVAFKGAGAFAKINLLIFASLMIACFVSIGSLFFTAVSFKLPPASYTDGAGKVHWHNASTFTPFSLATLRDNMYPSPVVSDQCAQASMFGSGRQSESVCNLQLVFSVVFPAVVGMMEGANLSGDFKDPARSIPRGTWAAVSTAFLFYILLIFGQAGTMSREALQYDMNVMQHATIAGGSFVIMGVTAACLSTALGSMFGSARILQAIARDDIFPGLSIFKQGSMKGDEPRAAIVVSYLLAQAGVLLGNLDDVAPVLTNFFLLTYSLVNLACFLLVVSRTPNFRPDYRIYSWQTSLLGVVLIIFVMFYLNWVYALTTVLVVLMLFVYVTFRFRGHLGWIDISQALIFRWARRGLLKLQTQKKDTKYWRPSVLLLIPAAGSIEEAGGKGFRMLVGFLNTLKQSGLYVLGQAHVSAQGPCDKLEDVVTAHQRLRAQLADVLELEVFTQLAVGASSRMACQNLMLGAGIGSVVPDTVALPLQGTGSVVAPADDAEEFVQVLRDALQLKRNLLLAANFGNSSGSITGGSSSASFGLRGSRVDLWVIGELQLPLSGLGDVEETAPEKSHLSLLLQLGHIFRSETSRVKGVAAAPALRLLQLCSAPAPSHGAAVASERQACLNSWCRWARVRAEVKLVELPAVSSGLAAWPGAPAGVEVLSQQISVLSNDASLILLLLPALPPSSASGGPGQPSQSSQAYVKLLSDLTRGLPPTLLIANGQGFPVITSAI